LIEGKKPCPKGKANIAALKALRHPKSRFSAAC
jgi:hypothetical protein